MDRQTTQHRSGPPLGGEARQLGGLPRAWRYALALGIFLQGAFASLKPPAAYAAGSDAITLGVTVGNPVPPAAITDLLASPDLAAQGSAALSWTAPQGNTGGVPINNWPVGQYIVRYATFSVDSLAGDTTSWWNAAVGNTITLQPPSYTPKAPGQFEGFTLSGLAMDVRYYFAIRSVSQTGVPSPIDSLASTPGQQASVLLILNAPTPRPPTGLLGTLNANLRFDFSWHSVRFGTNGGPITIDHYRVERYNVIGGTPTASFIVPVTTTTYVDSSVTNLRYYRVFAVSNQGLESDPSDYVDSSMNRIIVASDDLTTRVVLPRSLSVLLLAEGNTYADDLNVRMIRRSQDEVNVTLRSYQAGIFFESTDSEVRGFSFPQNDASIQLGYSSVVSAGQFSTPTHPNPAAAQSLAQIITVYWFNGINYVRMGDPILTVDQSIAVNARNLGIYQIRAVRISETFRMTPGSPYPRIITPNHPTQNNRVFFFFDNPTDEQVSGTIYDIRGAKVRELQVDSLSPTNNSIVWNGRDSQGAVVPSGVYLYKIQAGKESVTGTVVVAR